MADMATWTDPKTGVTVCVGDRWEHADGVPGEVVGIWRGGTTADAGANPWIDLSTLRGSKKKVTRWRAATFIKRFKQRSKVADPNALKPCPFCGGADLHFDNLNSVTCEKCGGTGGWGDDQDAPDEEQRAAGRRLWNQRVTEAKAANAYPSAGHPWADFLHHRARVLLAWEREGKSPEQSAALMSMDPGQVRLILAHVRSEEAKAGGARG